MKLPAVIVGALALALAAGTWKRMSDALGRQPEASAEMLPISKAGAWEAFEGTDTSGEPACAFALNHVNPAGGAIVIKSWGEQHVLHIIGVPGKQSWHWHLPTGTRITIRLRFNHHAPGEDIAFGETLASNGRLYTSIAGQNEIATFLKEFMVAQTLTVSFPDESREPPWSIDMWGADTTGRAFIRCVAAVEAAELHGLAFQHFALCNVAHGSTSTQEAFPARRHQRRVSHPHEGSGGVLLDINTLGGNVSHPHEGSGVDPGQTYAKALYAVSHPHEGQERYDRVAFARRSSQRGVRVGRGRSAIPMRGQEVCPTRTACADLARVAKAST